MEACESRDLRRARLLHQLWPFRRPSGTDPDPDPPGSVPEGGGALLESGWPATCERDALRWTCTARARLGAVKCHQMWWCWGGDESVSGAPQPLLARCALARVFGQRSREQAGPSSSFSPLFLLFFSSSSSPHPRLEEVESRRSWLGWWVRGGWPDVQPLDSGVRAGGADVRLPQEPTLTLYFDVTSRPLCC